MTTLNTDTRALRAFQEAMERKKPYYPEWFSVRFEYQEALVNAAPALIAKAEAYDRVERLCVGTSRRVLPYQIRRALAIPAGPKAGE